MDLERLKQLLTSGAITQEEYDEMAEGLEEAETKETETESSQEEEPETEEPDMDSLIAEKVRRELDKVTNKLGNENKRLREQLKEEQKKNLSVEEVRKLEMEEKEKELLEKEKALKTESNRIYAVKALKKAKLDDGSEETLDLLELVMGEDEECINAKVKALEKFVNALVGKKVDGIFKQNGRTPGKGAEGNTAKNPYKTGNLTEQMRLEHENPELANRLKASAEN